MSVLSVAVLALFSVARAAVFGGSSVKPVLAAGNNGSQTPHLRGKFPVDSGVAQLMAGMVNASSNSSAHQAPCQCEDHNPNWVPCARTSPMCIFIDLGAADGNTFQSFITGQYGPVQNCPSGGAWHATLVEANPNFNAALDQVAAQQGSAVYAAKSTAAYMCEGQTSFYLDTVNHEHNYWGSSMSANHHDVVKSGKTKVTVPTMNINRVLYEGTIPQDYVILKMDIEGAEWDVMPCLARAAGAHNIDRMYLEIHDQSWGNIGTTQVQMQDAVNRLKNLGVDIPDQYWSWTM